MTERKGRLVQVRDDEGIVLLAQTNLIDKEIKDTIISEKWDDKGSFDYEEKLIFFSEENNLSFERVYAEDVFVV